MLPAFPSPLRRLLPALLVLALAAAGLVVAGCGSSGGGNEDADPAKVSPKNTLVYLSAQVRPEGDQKDAVDAIAKKVLGVDDPGKRIQTLLDESIKESDSKLTYEDDIEPWLGRRAAIIVTSLGSGQSDTQAAAILASKDNGKAQDAIAKLGDEETPKAVKREYEGVDYRFRDNTAVGVVDDFVVAGTESGFKAVVDASKGDGLTDNKQYGTRPRTRATSSASASSTRRRCSARSEPRVSCRAAPRASRGSSDRPTSRSRSRWRRQRPGSPSRPSLPRRRRQRPSRASCSQSSRPTRGSRSGSPASGRRSRTA